MEQGCLHLDINLIFSQDGPFSLPSKHRHPSGDRCVAYNISFLVFQAKLPDHHPKAPRSAIIDTFASKLMTFECIKRRNEW